MYLKAILVDVVKSASNGNQYKTVTFQELSEYAQLPGQAAPVEVKTNATPHKRTLWSNQDGLFLQLNEKDVTFGTIKRFEVDEYQINQIDGTIRNASSFSGVQFRGESDDTTCSRYGKKLRKGSPVITQESLANAELIAQPMQIGEPLPV